MKENNKKHVVFIKKIVNEIQDFIDGFGAKCTTNFQEDNDSGFAVFVKGPLGYIPYIIRFDFLFLQDEINVSYYWAINNKLVPGDKSDSSVLWASLMSLLLKTVFNKKVITILQNNLCIKDEIGGAILFFPNGQIIYDKGYEKDKIKSCIAQFISAQSLIAFFFGSVSNVLTNKKGSTIYFEKQKKHVYIEREDYTFEWDGERCFKIKIENGICDFFKLCKFNEYRSEILNYNDYLFIKQYIGQNVDKRYIDKKNTNLIKKIIRIYEILDYEIVCQENMLFLLTCNEVFILLGDFTEENFIKQNYYIQHKEMEKNKFLSTSYMSLDWIYPVSPGRFETLIKDLLEEDLHNFQVRNCGKVNDRDGGKDITFYKNYIDYQTNQIHQILILGQCKAYNKTVNKSQVNDLRDTLEENGAKGYFLAVTETISGPLQNSLKKLKDNGYFIEFWTKDEIFCQLQSKLNLIEKYSDIIRIKEKKENM